MNELKGYSELLLSVKSRVRSAQIKAVLSANSELILLYWDIGRMIIDRQKNEGWGSAVIPRLSKDIRNELPEMKGFSERNIGYMVRFAQDYGDSLILQQPVAKSNHLFFHIPWGHNILLLEKVTDHSIRYWYMKQVVDQGWSRETLSMMLKSQAHTRQGSAISNFKERLPTAQSELALGLLKDPYIFDFLTLEEPFHERELETGLVQHLEKFLIELGGGFAYVGRQFRIEISDKDYYIDLLFYHLKLRAFIVIELKKGDFKPEYAGKINFYCSAVDDLLKHETDQPTIGLILCQTKDRILAEYSLRDINKPIGVSDYELTKALPKELKSSLPSIEEIEMELLGKQDG